MREFGDFKRDRRALAQWAQEFGPEIVVMESTGIYWKSPMPALAGARGHSGLGCQCAACQKRTLSQDRCGRCPVAGHLRVPRMIS